MTRNEFDPATRLLAQAVAAGPTNAPRTHSRSKDSHINNSLGFLGDRHSAAMHFGAVKTFSNARRDKSSSHNRVNQLIIAIAEQRTVLANKCRNLVKRISDTFESVLRIFQTGMITRNYIIHYSKRYRNTL